MIDRLLDLPSHLRVRLAQALESGLLTLPCTESALRSVLGTSEYTDEVAESLVGLHSTGISGAAVALWIRGIETANSRALKPDLVWSGPEVPGLYARDTRRVFEELLSSAERSVWVSTYAFFNGPKAFQVLARRMDSISSLRVVLLLNIQRRKGDSTQPDQLARAFADHFWSMDWPGSARPSVFYDPRSLDLAGPAGVLHAKTVVVDDEVVFVTSANLTEAALDHNIEVGLLVREQALANSLTKHFRRLIDEKLLRPLPST